MCAKNTATMIVSILSQSADAIKRNSFKPLDVISSDEMVIVTTISGSKKTEPPQTDYNLNDMSNSERQVNVELRIDNCYSTGLCSSNCEKTSKAIKSSIEKSSELSNQFIDSLDDSCAGKS